MRKKIRTFVLLGVVDHTLDFLLRQATLIVRDRNAIRLAGGLIGSGDVEDTVGIDIEGDLDLGDATRGGWDTRELELSEEIVILGARTLTLIDLDEDTRLVVGVCGEDLGLLGGDGGVTLDECCHDTTRGLDTQRERRNVEKEQILSLL